MKFLKKHIGIIITLIYALTLGWLIRDRVNELFTMQLNELGDFLAGAFGPIAIMWLILGYLQQGKELQQNTKALNLQADELKNTVEQQKELVEVAKLQYEENSYQMKHDREFLRSSNQPKFVFDTITSSTTSGSYKYKTVVHNTGKTATNITLTFNKDMKAWSPKEIASMLNGGNLNFIFIYPDSSQPIEDRYMIITYTDSFGIAGEVIFDFIPYETGNSKTVKIVEKIIN